MTTADYALIVSIFSATVALASFAWNVWSKFIYPKASVEVSFYEGVLTLASRPPWPSYLILTALNHGPTEITLQRVDIVISEGLPFRRGQHGIVNPIHDVSQPHLGVGPFAGGLPKKLAVGESHTAFFPHEAQSFARENLRKVGFMDSFGRFHWAKRRAVRTVKRALDEKYASEPYVPGKD